MNKPNDKTLCQWLGITVKLGKPFIINDENGKIVYYENINGYWYKKEYDSNGNVTYFEDSNGYRDGTPRSEKVTITMDEIAKRFGVSTAQLHIKK